MFYYNKKHERQITMRTEIILQKMDVHKPHFSADRWHIHLSEKHIFITGRLIRWIALSVFCLYTNSLYSSHLLREMNDQLHSKQGCAKFSPGLRKIEDDAKIGQRLSNFV